MESMAGNIQRELLQIGITVRQGRVSRKTRLLQTSFRYLHLTQVCTRPFQFMCVPNGLIGKQANGYRSLTQQMNPDCFFEKVGKFPERIENLYFLWAVVTRAVSKLPEWLKDHPFCEGSGDEQLVKAHVDKVQQILKSCPSTFDESLLFSTKDANLKTDFRDSFRNISRIMDCVGCEKCRLWGKVQITGLATALKLLFTEPVYDSRNSLTRMELVALVNAYFRFSESVRLLAEFDEMMKPKVYEGLLKEVDKLMGSPVDGKSPSSEEGRAEVGETGEVAEMDLPMADEAEQSAEAENASTRLDDAVIIGEGDLWQLSSPLLYYFGLTVAVLGSLKLIHKGYQKFNEPAKPHAKKD
jgi:Endoplasmic Reticulum Oxidoreductin 1 (ERO1)